jgi:hypothetical protein
VRGAWKARRKEHHGPSTTTGTPGRFARDPGHVPNGLDPTVVTQSLQQDLKQRLEGGQDVLALGFVYTRFQERIRQWAVIVLGAGRGPSSGSRRGDRFLIRL